MKAIVRLVDKNATINVNGVELSGENPFTTELTDNVKELSRKCLIHLEYEKSSETAEPTKGKKTSQITL